SRFTRPLNDAVGDDFADVFGVGELIRTRGKHRLEIREAAPERLGDAGADVEDSKAIKDEPHVAGFAGGNTVEKVAGGLLAHASEVGNLVQGAPIKFGDVLHQPVLDQLRNEHFPAALDIHRAARAPVLDPAADLSWAIRIGATRHAGLAFSAGAFG